MQDDLSRILHERQNKEVVEPVKNELSAIREINARSQSSLALLTECQDSKKPQNRNDNSVSHRIRSSLQPYIAQVQQAAEDCTQDVLRELLDVYGFKPLCRIRKICELEAKTEAALQENLRLAQQQEKCGNSFNFLTVQTLLNRIKFICQQAPRWEEQFYVQYILLELSPVRVPVLAKKTT